MYPMLIKNVSQVLDLVHGKGSFFQVGIYLVLPQSDKKLLNMSHVLLPSSAEDEDVIQICHHKRVGEGSQYIIHQPHESGWCICYAKGPDQPFKETFFRFEICLPNIIWFNGNLVVVRL
jgi:hypothetical protein